MNLLQSDQMVEVAEPYFDRPETADTPSALISAGTRVELSFQGNPVYAQIETVERLGTAFVGRTVKPTGEGQEAALLRPGDLVRFRLRDIHGLA